MTKMTLVVFLFLSLFGKAQEKTKILYSNNSIEITAILEDCERKDQGTHIQYYYLNVTNLTTQKISISFKREMWYNNKCISCNQESDEHLFTDTFLANETKKGDCYTNTTRQYRVFSKMLNIDSKSVLTDFKVKNIIIKEL